MGIDYGRFAGPNGLPNRDPETGIRYGILNRHDLGELETDLVYAYSCPDCEQDLDGDEDTCPGCETELDMGDCSSEEPIGEIFDIDGVKGEIGSLGVWIYKSPFVAEGLHASPCCPGAVTLEKKTALPTTVSVETYMNTPRIGTGEPIAYTVPADWWA